MTKNNKNKKKNNRKGNSTPIEKEILGQNKEVLYKKIPVVEQPPVEPKVPSTSSAPPPVSATLVLEQTLQQRNEEIKVLNSTIEKINLDLKSSREQLEKAESEIKKYETLKLKQDYKVADSETDIIVDSMKKLYLKNRDLNFSLENELDVDETHSIRFVTILNETLFRVCGGGNTDVNQAVENVKKMLKLLFPEVGDFNTTSITQIMTSLVSNTLQLCSFIKKSTIPKFALDWNAEEGRICVMPSIIVVSNSSPVIIKGDFEKY